MEKEYIVEAYKRMCNIRQFDNVVHEYAEKNYLVMGITHSAVGAEAYSVAVAMNLNEEDYIATTYRNHAHTIARNMDLNSLAAEICGRDTGCCRGKAGNMHAIDQDKNIIAGFGIIGAGLPSCLGTAFAARYLNQDKITVGFFGDGAIPQGTFHESMNLAAIWKLPVLFVNDNNKYAMSTATAANLVTTDTINYAKSYNMPAIAVDGLNFFAVDAAVKLALSHMKRGEGPYFIECKGYRYHGQWEGDLEIYKPKDEVEYYKTRDPLKLFETACLENAYLTQSEMDIMKEEAKQRALAAFEYAKTCDFPKLEELYTNVFAD